MWNSLEPYKTTQESSDQSRRLYGQSCLKDCSLNSCPDLGDTDHHLVSPPRLLRRADSTRWTIYQCDRPFRQLRWSLGRCSVQILLFSRWESMCLMRASSGYPMGNISWQRGQLRMSLSSVSIQSCNTHKHLMRAGPGLHTL